MPRIYKATVYIVDPEDDYYNCAEIMRNVEHWLPYGYVGYWESSLSRPIEYKDHLSARHIQYDKNELDKFFE